MQRLFGDTDSSYQNALKRVGSFFSGLIDDVRIYNQALSAEQIEALAQ